MGQERQRPCTCKLRLDAPALARVGVNGGLPIGLPLLPLRLIIFQVSFLLSSKGYVAKSKENKKKRQRVFLIDSEIS